MSAVWREDYNLGIPSIDVQHRRLIDIINEFSCYASEENVSHADIDAMLIRVEQHAHEHFAYEEGYFAKFDYQESIPHMHEHQAFSEKIEEFRKRTGMQDPHVFVEALDYLEQWFLHHVLVVDRRYVDLFLAMGAE